MQFNDLSPLVTHQWLRIHGFSNLIGPNSNFVNVPVFQYNPQLLGEYPLFFLQHYFNPFASLNILTLLTIIITFIFTWKLFSFLKFERPINLLLTLSYTFSPFYIFRLVSVSHTFYYTFIFPLIIRSLLKKESKLIIGCYITLAFYLNNYYGYFIFIIASGYLIIKQLIEQTNFTKLVLSIFYSLLSLIAVPGLLILLPNISTVKHSTYLLGNYSQNEFLQEQIKFVPYRTIEDYFNFSILPWYFLLPPKESYFLGNVSRYINQQLKDTNYYLFQYYESSEAGGLFLGWHFTISSIVTLMMILKNKKSVDNSVLTLILLSLCIIAISLPPYVMVNGIKIYTPSYLIYYLFPSFRVLVRWGVFLFLVNLLVSGISINKLYIYLSKNSYKYLSYTFFLLMCIFNIIQFTLKVNVVNLEKPPEYITYLKNQDRLKRIAVYPNNFYEAQFWLPWSGNILINPYYLTDKEFSAKTFEENLFKEGDTALIQKYKVDAILILNNRIEDQEKIKYLKNNYVNIAEFQESSLYELNKSQL